MTENDLPPQNASARRKQENMRIPPVHTKTLQSTMGTMLMKSFFLIPLANLIFAKSHLPLITPRQLLRLNLLSIFVVQSWSWAVEARLVLVYVRAGLCLSLWSTEKSKCRLTCLRRWLGQVLEKKVDSRVGTWTCMVL